MNCRIRSGKADDFPEFEASAVVPGLEAGAEVILISLVQRALWRMVNCSMHLFRKLYKLFKSIPIIVTLVLYRGGGTPCPFISQLLVKWVWTLMGIDGNRLCYPLISKFSYILAK